MIQTGRTTRPAALGTFPQKWGEGSPRSHPFAVVRRQIPAPVLGLMEIPAVERRPFPVPCVGLMETFYQ